MDARISQSFENLECGVRVDGKYPVDMSTVIRDGKSGTCAADLAPDDLGIRLVRAPSLLETVRAA
jgi:hypothetical protein